MVYSVLLVHGMIVHLYIVIFRVNRLYGLRHTHTHLDSKRETVHGESIGKAVRDLMRLSSGLEYLKYVLVCTIPQIGSEPDSVTM